ncbi:hypothetical protein [Agrobacterium tumefaciens]|uniref:hypothetical protein n=1 Tax=Agrobacterium tumefaciens TaxID=358 RepID=UPI0022439E6C|nr:hypothetical protein [Agrobacterium tumefaciens]MCW8059634.1 hypothetical protein [Agrobacterium tumefaciens]MCW8146264.1 hypothetical protein [Agrobacterium tumefaciens]
MIHPADTSCFDNPAPADTSLPSPPHLQAAAARHFGLPEKSRKHAQLILHRPNAPDVGDQLPEAAASINIRAFPSKKQSIDTHSLINPKHPSSFP